MKILLSTLHSRYSHASLALPCLATFCQDMPGVDISIRELLVSEPREHLLRLLMAEQADMIAFSCYIWNSEQTLRIVSDIKKIAPHIIIVLGGPEVYAGIFELMHNNPAIDFVIKGEGEETFRGLIEVLACDDAVSAADRFAAIDNLFFRDGLETVSGPARQKHLELDRLPSPFAAGLVDLGKTLVYFETSRGCPFACAFCLSSVESDVRSFSLDRIKNDLLLLMGREVPYIKLVDRTFNYDAGRADTIWSFILEHNRNSHFHFEIAADLLTDSNMDVLARVPENTFRFEIGIQSASQGTLAQVKRGANLQRIFSNVRRLVSETKVDVHLDLIAGLPGEGYEGFLASLQAVAELPARDIQIEPLKLLKGTHMREIGRREGYRFSDSPPYTILGNPWLTYHEICRIETIGRLLDLFNKHGGCVEAFNVLTCHVTFSAVLDQMARQAANENLSHLSCRKVFELFARLAEPLLDTISRTAMLDALFFDYCCNEMPQMGKLPGFAAEHQNGCSWPSPRDITHHLHVPPDCRVRCFRFVFMHDYRAGHENAGSAAITFVYVSGEGRGLTIQTVE